MAITLTGGENIAQGWGKAPELRAPEIGSLVGAILRNRLGQQELTQNSIAATIKELQQQRESSAYIEAAQRAGLLPEGDYGGLGLKGGSDIARLIAHQNETAAREAYMKRYYEALTERAGRPDARGGRGAPRYPYTIPGTDETVDLPGEAYARRRAEDVTTGSYQGILKSEADAKAKMQELETKWGGTVKGQLKGAPAWPWQEDTTKAERTKDQILYNRAQQQWQMNQEQRQNLEKRKPGIVGGAPAPVETGTEDTEDTTMPPGVTYVPGPSNEPNKPVTRGEKIDEATVAQYIKKAGGDTAAARRMAQEDGWTF